jgi:hypothetical protein
MPWGPGRIGHFCRQPHGRRPARDRPDDLSRDEVIGLPLNEDDRTHEAKEMTMRSHGPATVWGTALKDGRGRDAKGWYQQLQEWRAARKAARQQAKLVALTNRWDAEHEAVTPLRADAAVEMAIAQGTLALATQPVQPHPVVMSGGPLDAGVGLGAEPPERALNPPRASWGVGGKGQGHAR